MSGVERICGEVRKAWLEAAPDTDPAYDSHLEACDACRSWVERAEACRRALVGLPRSAAPAPLERGVREELQRPRWVGRVLQGLARQEVSAELEGRIAAELLTRTAAPDSPRLERDIQALQTLTCHAAPHVLDRLVAEELAAPQPHRTERFTDLERMRAPDELSQRIERRMRRRDLVRRLGPLVTSLAAASLFLWLTLSGVFAPSTPPARSFEVVHATDASLLHPWVRETLGAMGGDGVAPAAPGAAAGPEGEAR